MHEAGRDPQSRKEPDSIELTVTSNQFNCEFMRPRRQYSTAVIFIKPSEQLPRNYFFYKTYRETTFRLWKCD